ncbi:MAG: hypothetical protein ABI585_11665 [Betaproteobacteria bacterium]
MNARTLATTTLILLAATTAACQRTTSTPPQPAVSGMDGSSLSAPAAPSLAGSPLAAVPATHAFPQEAPTATEPTARDTPANAPAAMLTEQKEKTEMPLAGQANNHSSPAFESGRDEKSGNVAKAVEAPKPAS